MVPCELWAEVVMVLLSTRKLGGQAQVQAQAQVGR